MVLSLIGVFSFGTDKASADTTTGWGYFATEDGRWDGKVTTTSADNNIRVHFRYLWKTDGYGANPAYPGNLWVRLCNASTGACTATKEMYGDQTYVTFTGMKIGTFYLDVQDGFSWLYIYGERKIDAY